MQRSVLERWIDNLAERQFDAHFLLLLRANGFYDIHFTHGAYEFGKDFIAKRIEAGVPRQYGFQSKAGDISGSAWDSIHGQLEELVASWLVHPNYDQALSKEHRLVTTGLLKGKAILSAKQYKERLAARSEGNFIVWDRENLLDMLQGLPPAEAVIHPSIIVDKLIAAATTNELSRKMLSERLGSIEPRSESIHHLREALLQVSFVISHLLSVGRPFYAVRIAQHGVRLALVNYVRSPSEEGYAEYLGALRYSVQFGIEQVRRLAKLEPIDLARKSGGVAGHLAAYPLTCYSIIEALGLGVLEALWRGSYEVAKQLSRELVEFVTANPGCLRPLSDRFACSLVPPVVALAVTGEVECGRGLLRGVTKWVCDQMENGFGLAGPYASAQEEVERIFGSRFDFIDYQVRHESLFAVVLADLCYVFFPDLYPSIVNELKAVEAIPSAIHPLDLQGSMFLSSGETQSLINLEYPDTIEQDVGLEHHSLQIEARFIEKAGGPLAPLICGCLCQDRVYTDIFPRLWDALRKGLGLGGVVQ